MPPEIVPTPATSQAVDEVAVMKLHGRYWLLLIPVLVSGAFLYVLDIYFSVVFFERLPKYHFMTEDNSDFLVDTPACRIPALNPWNENVRPYVKSVQSLDCSRDRRPPLVASNTSALFVIQDAFAAYHISDPEDMECCYTEFFRVEDEYPSDNRVRFDDNCTFFKNEVSVEGMEFLRVNCYYGGKNMYEDYFSFVPRKPQIEERCRNSSTGADKDAMSILVLVIDSVSRLNIHRQMPKTIQRLTELNATEMLGFHKVGKDTLGNLVPLLSGLSEQELKRKCWPSNDDFFDKCRFVWNDFRDAGYRTAFADDATLMSFFNWQKGGFSKKPTDYYLRPFFKTANDKIGHHSPMLANLCLGSRMITEVLLDYLAKFSLEFKSSLTYAFFKETSLSHDDLNYPSLSDDLHVSLFNRMEENGVLERLAILFLSDHGIRLGSFRETYQGRMEDRLPFLFLILPAWFRHRYPAAVSNAGRNARRLTTHFDVHETLLDLMRPTQRLTLEAVRRRSGALTTQPPPRGISLFLQMPPIRSCEDAGIIPQGCSCRTSLPVEKDGAIVTRTAKVLIDHINEIVRPFRQCSQLFLHAVKSIQLEVPQENLTKDTDKDVHGYVLVVMTVPGYAVFEGTVRHQTKKDEFRVTNDINRLNIFRTQSFCVYNNDLKPYCVCKNS